MSSAVEQLNRLVESAEEEENELKSMLGRVTKERLALEGQGLSVDEFQTKHNELTTLLTNYCSRFFAAKKKTVKLRNQRDDLTEQGKDEVEKLTEEIAVLQARCNVAESKLIDNNSRAAIIKCVPPRTLERQCGGIYGGCPQSTLSCH